jgi:hypothetical protein
VKGSACSHATWTHSSSSQPLPPIAVYSQSTGEIKLRVTDPSGAALRASGRVNGPGGFYRTFETEGRGDRGLTALAPGHYRLQIIRSGFVHRYRPHSRYPHLA